MIPEVVLQPNLPDPSRNKQFSRGTCHKKGTTPPPDDEEIGLDSMLPDYVPLMSSDAPKVTIYKNVKYQLVSPSISKGVRMTTKIRPKLKKLGFIDHEMCKFPKCSME